MRLMPLMLLVACEGQTIKFPDTASPLDDTGLPDSDSPTDSDSDTGGQVVDTSVPFQGATSLRDADVILSADEPGDGVGYNYSLSAAGDVTGDGLGDLVVGARYAGDKNYTGKAYVVADPPEGTNALSDVASVVLRGSEPRGMFGYSVAGLGDANGDGFGDVAVGAPAADEGAVYVFYGPFFEEERSDTEADAVLVGESTYSYTGMTMAPAGDMNADGSPDLVIGAPSSSAGCSGCGAVYVSLTVGEGEESLLSDDSVRIYGDREHGIVGYGVSSGGDLDGDGFPDLMVGAPYSAAGGVATWYGPFRSSELDIGDSDAWFAGATLGSYAGMSEAAYDVDGDGYDDLLVGAPYDNTSGNMAGQTFVQFGTATRFEDENPLAEAASSFLGVTNDASGSSVASAGDVDGDGTIDLLIGAPYSSAGANYGGGAYLVYGPVTPGAWQLTESPAFFAGGQVSGQAGGALAGPGDTNGDELADVAVGSIYGMDSMSGAIFLFRGE